MSKDKVLERRLLKLRQRYLPTFGFYADLLDFISFFVFTNKQHDVYLVKTARSLTQKDAKLRWIDDKFAHV